MDDMDGSEQMVPFGFDGCLTIYFAWGSYAAHAKSNLSYKNVRNAELEGSKETARYSLLKILSEYNVEES